MSRLSQPEQARQEKRTAGLKGEATAGEGKADLGI
jgi:hypothetical protein